MAAITNYTDVVTLAETKEYLRLDDNGGLLDAELTRYIGAACQLIEQYTNHRLKPQDKLYALSNGRVNVYDYPIISVQEPTDPKDFEPTPKNLYTTFCVFTDADILALRVGYEDTVNVPPILIQAVLEVIRVWYYSAESDTQKGVLPEAAKAMVGQFKRFVF